MKALAIKQPWAEAIVSGLKDIENRTWQTKFRGPVLIHASKSWDWGGCNFIRYRLGEVAGTNFTRPARERRGGSHIFSTDFVRRRLKVMTAQGYVRQAHPAYVKELFWQITEAGKDEVSDNRGGAS